MSDPVAFAREKLAPALDELKPLFGRCWEALDTDKGLPLDPDWSRYLHLDRAGMLHLFTARVARAPVGAAMFVVLPPLHYKDCRWARSDVVWVDEAHRRRAIGRRLLDFALTSFRKEGIHTVAIGTRNAHGELSALLSATGFAPVETLYLLPLGETP